MNTHTHTRQYPRPTHTHAHTSTHKENINNFTVDHFSSGNCLNFLHCPKHQTNTIYLLELIFLTVTDSSPGGILKRRLNLFSLLPLSMEKQC